MNHRVAFLSHSAALSGAELWLLGMLSRTRRIEPVVVLSEHGPLVAEMRSRGIETHTLDSRALKGDVATGSSAVRTAARAVSAMPAYVSRLRSLLTALDVEVAYSNSARSHVVSVPVARTLRLPTVVHVHDHMARHTFSLPALTALQCSSQLADLVIANSRSTAATLRGGAARRSHVVHCPSEVPASHAEVPAAPHPGRLLLGCFGRISPWKGQHLAIEACRRLRERGHEVELGIFGAALFDNDVAYAQDLRRQVAEAGLSDVVTFHGHVDVGEHLPRCDVALHTSTRAEPFGQVVVEAMAAGVPVVAARAGGPLEVITHGVDGLLYEMGDVESLVSTLDRVLDDGAARQALGRGGRARAGDFSYEAILPPWEDLVLSLLERRQ